MLKPREAIAGLLFLPLVIGLFSTSAQAAEIDLLHQKAPMTAKWRSFVQLGITSAGKRVVSVGERGSILLSDDAGTNWRQASVPTSCALVSVAFSDSQTGYATGHCGVVLKTTDGGESWQMVLDGIAAAKIEEAEAVAEQGGAAVETRRVREARLLVSDGPDKPFFSMMFADAQHGIVVGAYGLAFETRDGGQSWQSLAGLLSDAAGRHIYAIANYGGAIFLAGEQCTILTTNKGGESYSPIPLPSKATQFGLVASDKSLITYGLKGAAYRTDDGGKHWSHIPMPATSITSGLRLRNGDLLLGNEAGQLFRSNDGGVNFREDPIKNPAPISALAEASDGAIIRAGARGVSRVEFITSDTKNASR